MDLQKRTTIFSRLFWDYTYTIEEIENMMAAPAESLEKQKVLLRLLMSCQWYTLKNILSEQELKQAMDDRVLQKIHIVSLRNKYIYARQFL